MLTNTICGATWFLKLLSAPANEKREPNFGACMHANHKAASSVFSLKIEMKSLLDGLGFNVTKQPGYERRPRSVKLGHSIVALN